MSRFHQRAGFQGFAKLFWPAPRDLQALIKLDLLDRKLRTNLFSGKVQYPKGRYPTQFPVACTEGDVEYSGLALHLKARIGQP